MRLSVQQINIIKDSVKNNFGASSRVFLFGSRLDDNKKGGDIDIFVCADFSEEELFLKKIYTMSEVQLRLGERKIDIITSRDLNTNKTLIVNEAVKNGIEL